MTILRRLLLVLCLGLPCLGAFAASGDTFLPLPQDLPRAAAAANARGLPLILLVSLTDCAFCEKIRREHLSPLLKSGVPVWQIYLDTDAQLVGFDGKPITERQLAKDLKVRVAPTVFFFDAKGRQLSAPLVGTMLDDFYAGYLEQAILTAGKKITF